MKIEINVSGEIEDMQVVISCKEVTPEIEKMVATLRMMERQLTGRKDGQTFIIPVEKVIYMEAVDRKCFLYTEEAVYESDFKLYELEEQLKESWFIRISKSMMINLKKVQSLKAGIDRRILITMQNGEQIVASRQYAEELKRKLGVK